MNSLAIYPGVKIQNHHHITGPGPHIALVRVKMYSKMFLEAVIYIA